MVRCVVRTVLHQPAMVLFKAGVQLPVVQQLRARRLAMTLPRCTTAPPGRACRIQRSSAELERQARLQCEPTRFEPAQAVLSQGILSPRWWLRGLWCCAWWWSQLGASQRRQGAAELGQGGALLQLAVQRIHLLHLGLR